MLSRILAKSRDRVRDTHKNNKRRRHAWAREKAKGDSLSDHETYVLRGERKTKVRQRTSEVKRARWIDSFGECVPLRPWSDSLREKKSESGSPGHWVSARETSAHITRIADIGPRCPKGNQRIPKKIKRGAIKYLKMY